MTQYRVDVTGLRPRVFRDGARARRYAERALLSNAYGADITRQAIVMVRGLRSEGWRAVRYLGAHGWRELDSYRPSLIGEVTP